MVCTAARIDYIPEQIRHWAQAGVGVADVQPEKGYLYFANTLWDALCRTRIPGQERQVFDAIARLTYGQQDNEKPKGHKKKMAEMTQGLLAHITGLDRRRVNSCLVKLLDKNMILKRVTIKGGTERIFYGIQKDYDRWILPPKRVHPKSATKKGGRSVTKYGAPIKKRNKTPYNPPTGRVQPKGDPVEPCTECQWPYFPGYDGMDEHNVCQDCRQTEDT